tara:strand:+ start:890 stop:1084 length:195 start_codon:yes stop_codon:yes gene_type:complete
MKRIIPSIAFACLSGFAATTALPVMSGGCSNHINKKIETKCADDDTNCQTEKAKKFELNKTVRS